MEKELISTRQHFEILDGLRGIAAIAVVFFHFMEIAIPNYPNNFIAHGFLAVDFFFCLSGFVIAYAYDQRILKIGALNFLKLRLIRLHPLVIIGSVIGLFTWIFDPFSDLYAKYGSGKTFWMFITSCLQIPYPIVRERYFNIFHLNPPTWSLFWEYIANIAYAFILVKLRNKILWLLLVVAAGLLFYEAHRSTFLGVGWSGDNVMGGGIRVFYSFLAGMLVYRSKWIIKNNLGFLTLSILLLLSFLVPFSEKTNWLSNPLIVMFYFPFLVALGAGTRISKSMERICKFSGDISYPLYMTHYPFIWIFLSYVETIKPPMSELLYIMPIGTLLLIAFAYVVMIYVDNPVRAYLRNRMTLTTSPFPKIS